MQVWGIYIILLHTTTPQHFSGKYCIVYSTSLSDSYLLDIKHVQFLKYKKLLKVKLVFNHFDFQSLSVETFSVWQKMKIGEKFRRWKQICVRELCFCFTPLMTPWRAQPQGTMRFYHFSCHHMSHDILFTRAVQSAWGCHIYLRHALCLCDVQDCFRNWEITLPK